MKRLFLFLTFFINIAFGKDIYLLDKNGNKIELPKDKIIIINFMAYSCGHCMAEIPIFKKVLKKEEFKDKFYIVAFAIDGKENNFKDKDFPIYANNPKNQVIFPIFGTPTTYIIKNGKKINVIYGAITEENLIKFLRESLKK